MIRVPTISQKPCMRWRRPSKKIDKTCPLLGSLQQGRGVVPDCLPSYKLLPSTGRTAKKRTAKTILLPGTRGDSTSISFRLSWRASVSRQVRGENHRTSCAASELLAAKVAAVPALYSVWLRIKCCKRLRAVAEHKRG